METVVVTGVGMVTSLGVTAAETFNALSAGGTGIRPLTAIETEGFECRIGAQAHVIDPRELGVHPRDAHMMRLQGLMLMKAARDAFVNGDLDPSAMDGDSVGLFVGMGYMDYEFEELLPAVRVCLNRDGSFDDGSFFSHGYREIHPLWPLSVLNNMALCQVAIHLGIKGENAVFAPCGDAGAWAVAEGAYTVAEGRAAVVLAGGVSDKISRLSLARNLSADGMIADPPLMRDASSFSRDKGNEPILGEGCGLMVLESRSDAEKRGAPFLAEVSGFGSSFDRERERPWPTSEAVQGAMEEAMADAGIGPSCVDLVIAHGDGTDGDPNENDAICRLFSGEGKPVEVYASKGALGNLLAASPVVDAILGICMMKKGIIPAALPVAQWKSPAPLNLMCGKAMQKSPEHVLINTRSHQGQCASLVISACR